MVGLGKHDGLFNNQTMPKTANSTHILMYCVIKPSGIGSGCSLAGNDSMLNSWRLTYIAAHFDGNRMTIEKSTYAFLKALSRNNHREWFQKNKDRYLASQSNMTQWVDALIEKMNVHDQLQTKTGKEALYRIYNDVRFAADKTPYNPRFAGSLKRIKPYLRGGYYFWIKPGESRVGCGFTYPNSEDLLRIRQDIDTNYTEWRKLLKSKSLQNTFGNMDGEQVKTAPRGFEKDHPAIDLLRFKQFWFAKSFTDKEVLAPDFIKQVDKTFRAVRPFFDYMTEVLTTDLNGVSKIK
jgi:uncharacterized protein (TIGR02453 family)